MKNKLKNIFNLSKIFIKENNNGLNIIDKTTKKINKKSLLFWVYIILFFSLIYITFELLDVFKKVGKPEIFLNGYFLFIEFLLLIRTIMISSNIFYFSKDIENFLHLPFKTIEILISKFFTILFMNYSLELIFGLMPLAIYGNYFNLGITYFLNLIIVLLLFPIFITTIISIIMIFLMKTIKIFKNKDNMQIFLTFILIFILMFFMAKGLKIIFQNSEAIENQEGQIINNINNKIIKVNNYFININPSINILQKNNNLINYLINYLKLFLINIFSMVIFMFIGNKLYLKQLLKANFYFKNKKSTNLNLNKKIKKRKKGISYVKKEFKILIKNPLFFIQTIYPVIISTVTFVIMILALVPKFSELMQRDDIKEKIGTINFDIEVACIIIGAIQFIGLSNYSSITAFSREGKNAFITKYLPISLYKQFIYKNIPQILINTFCNLIIFLIMAIKIPSIKIKYIILMFFISLTLNIINSFILTIIDLLMPKLDWDAEYEILKNNKNKLLQYVLIIFNILFLIFIKDLFDNHNLDKSMGIFLMILIFILVIFNIIIYKLKNKLFKKII